MAPQPALCREMVMGPTSLGSFDELNDLLTSTVEAKGDFSVTTGCSQSGSNKSQLSTQLMRLGERAQFVSPVRDHQAGSQEETKTSKKPMIVSIDLQDMTT
jgi:hypothetical protein